MAEKIAEKFENAMKTGFISSLILIVLERKPSYGYKIGKEIEERTLGIWNPPSSTMYTVLKDMTKKHRQMQMSTDLFKKQYDDIKNIDHDINDHNNFNNIMTDLVDKYLT